MDTKLTQKHSYNNYNYTPRFPKAQQPSQTTKNFYVIMTVNEASRKNDLYSITEPTVTKFLQIRLIDPISYIIVQYVM